MPLPGAPAIRVLKAAAEERAEPLHAELLHTDAATVSMTQCELPPLQLTTDIVDERPKGE